MSLKALQDYIFVSRYARYDKEKKRRETWAEAVERVQNMHLSKYPQAEEQIKWAFNFVKQKKVLGSQRGLQFGGKPILDKQARIYNCCSSYVDRFRFFQEGFWLLLCGCGIGFSVQKHHIDKLPSFLFKISREKKTYIIPDTIEGWSDSLGILLATYFPSKEFSDWADYEVEFDFTQIRHRGAELSYGGKAPGPLPLKRALEIIRGLLEDRRVKGPKLRPIDAYDIVMHSSDAVLAGGVRRSATICMFSHDDEEMLNSKTGNWFVDNPQRGRSNNSAVILKDKISREDFYSIIKRTKEFGEPGFILVDNAEQLYNPCVTGDTLITTDRGLFPAKSLVGKPFNALVHGKTYKTLSDGFFYTGDKEVVELEFESGRKLRLTSNHKVELFHEWGYYWKEAGQLTYSDQVVINNHVSAVPDYDRVVSTKVAGPELVYDVTIDEVHCFGANGVSVHNCVEAGFYSYDTNGESGWEFCNLTEINGRKMKTKEDFFDACKAASIIGTLQAGYTKFDYLTKASENITNNEALLGVSITGIMDNPDVLLNDENQRLGAEIVLSANEIVAKLIGVNPTARGTLIKPAGSTSCILGTASGIHPHHAKRYFRRVQANKMEAPLKLFREANPFAVEESVWSANHTDDVITFCIEVQDGAKTKNDLSAIELLKIVHLTQNNWVKYGKNESRCSKPFLSHNVSNTINVKEDEWDAVADFIYDHRESFAGISLLPTSGDLDYQQAPMVNIHTALEIVKIYGDASIFASGLITDGLRLFDNNLWNSCDFVINNLSGDNEKEDWKVRVRSFADKYFESNVKKACYCMKEVHNWKLWLDLKRQYQGVDYTSMIENEDNTSTTREWACSGGKCELV